MTTLLKWLIKNKKIVFVTGDRKKQVSEFIGFVLKKDYSIYYLNRLPSLTDLFSILRCDMMIIEDSEEMKCLDVNSFLEDHFCTFVVTHTLRKKRIREFLSKFNKEWNIILDFSIAKKLKRKRGKDVLTYGINKKSADFSITDINIREKQVNFKINYKGKTIPFWIDKKLKKSEIYAILPALCLAEILKLNLAEVSFRIKEEFALN